jgi:membrane protein YqaA with SNARE-associated domain
LGLLTLFGICFLSATIIPFPSEAAFVYALKLEFDPFWVIAIASLGNSLGGSTNYFIGKFGREKFSKKEYPKSEKWVKRFGTYASFFSFIPFIGDPMMIVMGFYKTKLLPTLFWMTLGKTLRFIVLYYSYSFIVN